MLILAAAHSLNWYRFIGRILGKALYEGILVDIAFATFFLAKVSHFECVHASFVWYSVLASGSASKACSTT